MIDDPEISDAILDYDVFMREAREISESSRSNHFINSDILLYDRMYELYVVEHLKDSAIVHRDDMMKVSCPSDLKLLSYNEFDIKIAMNSMSHVRTVDQHNYLFRCGSHEILEGWY